MASPKERVFESGPWRGSLRISEPFVGANDVARLMVDGYCPDPTMRSGFYMRPGIVTTQTVASAGNGGQGVYAHTADNGTHYNFLFVNGKVWRWPTDLTSAPVDVTPLNVTISTTARVYATSLDDQMIVNDGQNVPWLGSALSSTPITATVIEYAPQAATVLSASTTNDRQVRSVPFYALFNGDFLTRDIPAAGVALPTGTIPASTWGVYRVSVDDTAGTSGVFTVTAGLNNYISGYLTEAAAIAAVPATPNGEWNVGYFTVQTAVGQPFIAGTDALAGGASGNPANATNYYAGQGYPWTAFGQPVIYTGAVFFILDRVASAIVATFFPSGEGIPQPVSARTTITWSEPNQPNVGYQQTDFDNNWTLTQTSSEPLYALAATNDALYYFRRLSIGAITGAPNINFQNTATHDVVSANVGCTLPATVATFLNYVYFADQQGRPWRFPIGGRPEPLWHQARELFSDSATRIATSMAAGNGWGIIEPNLNLYLCCTIPSQSGVTAPDLPLVFDANTGDFFGVWRVGNGAEQDAAGLVYGASGDPTVLILEGPTATRTTTVALRRVTKASENVWADTAPGSILFVLQSHWAGMGTMKSYQVTHVTALVEVGDAQPVVPMSGTVYTTQGTQSLPSITPVALGVNVDGIGRYVWQPQQVQGRAVRAQIVAPACQSHQINIHILSIYAV